MYKILIVDDEPFIREGLKKIIEGQNSNYCISDEAEDGTDALDLISLNIPDIVITDIRMIEMDGPELIKRAYERYSTKIKFIILSAYADFLCAQTTMKYGVCYYILKPIDSKELLEAINKIIQEIEDNARIESLYQSGIQSVMLQDMKRFVIGGLRTNTYEKMINYFDIQEEQYYRCAIVTFTIANSETEKYRINSIKTVQIQDKACKCVIEESLLRYCLILQESDDSFSTRDYDKLLTSIFKELPRGKITAFIGNSIKGFNNIGESYLNAAKAFDYKFYCDNDFLVFYEEIARKESKYDCEELPFLDLILQNIYEKNTKTINNNLDMFFEYMKSKHIHPEIIKMNLNRFAVNITKKISEFGGSIQEIEEFNEALHRLDYTNINIVALKSIFEKFCIQCISVLDEMHGDKPNDIIFKIQEYIKINYKTDVKIKDIAEEFYMNPVYLGQLFKKKFGIYINDYINELRIEEAKKLLVSTRYKVYEISSMIGFINSDYFTTKFEKMVGMTPLQYRKEGNSKFFVNPICK